MGAIMFELCSPIICILALIVVFKNVNKRQTPTTETMRSPVILRVRWAETIYFLKKKNKSYPSCQLLAAHSILTDLAVVMHHSVALWIMSYDVHLAENLDDPVQPGTVTRRSMWVVWLCRESRVFKGQQRLQINTAEWAFWYSSFWCDSVWLESTHSWLVPSDMNSYFCNLCGIRMLLTI